MNPQDDFDKIPWEEEGLTVAFDYEASGLHPDDGARPSVLAVAYPGGSAVLPFDQGLLDKDIPGWEPSLFGDVQNLSSAQWYLVHEWLGRQDLVAHNAKADLWYAWAGIRNQEHATRVDLSKAYMWDTMVVASLLWPNDLVGLKPVSKKLGWATDEADLLSKWLKKHKVDKQPRYDLAPWDLIEPYARADAELTLRLYDFQFEMIEEGELDWTLAEREIEMARTLFKIEQRGIPFDTQGAREVALRLDKEAGDLAYQLPFKPNRQQEVRQYFFGECGVAPLAFTDKGTAKLDQDLIDHMVKGRVKWAEEFGRYTKLTNARGLWYGGWSDKAGEDDRIRASYRQIKAEDDSGRMRGAVSGRFAVQRVNVQAIPHDYQCPEDYPPLRSFIRPIADQILYEMDLSQAEMRVVACLADCTPMLDQFAQGFDAHDATTRLVWEIEKDDPMWKQRRAVAKRLGFGVVYGAGIATLREQILAFTGEDMPEEHVRQLWDRYRDAFPELFRFSRRCEQVAIKTGRIPLAGGRMRWFRPYESTHKAMNAAIQGSVAELMKIAMNDAEEQVPGKLIGQIHDSFLVQVGARGPAEKIAGILQSTFEEHFENKCAFPVDLTEWT